MFLGGRAKKIGNLSLIFAIVIFLPLFSGGRHFETFFTCSRLEQNTKWYGSYGRGHLWTTAHASLRRSRYQQNQSQSEVRRIGAQQHDTRGCCETPVDQEMSLNFFFSFFFFKICVGTDGGNIILNGEIAARHLILKALRLFSFKSTEFVKSWIQASPPCFTIVSNNFSQRFGLCILFEFRILLTEKPRILGHFFQLCCCFL